MILIDLSRLLNACAHITVDEGNEVDESTLTHYVINSIISTKSQFGKKYGDIVIAVDSKPYWRKKIFEHYKAHRVAMRAASPIDWDIVHGYFNNITRELKAVFPYRVIEVNGAEADDVIGVLASVSMEPTLIHATDNDFNQLLRNPVVKQFSPITKKWIPDLHLAEIEWNLFFKIAKGDAGDGTPSCVNPSDCFVNGVRQKPLSEKTIMDWYKNGIPEIHKKRFMENKQLIDLRDTPAEIRQQILDEYAKPITGSRGMVYKYLIEKKLNKLASMLLEDMNRI